MTILPSHHGYKPSKINLPEDILEFGLATVDKKGADVKAGGVTEIDGTKNHGKANGINKGLVAHRSEAKKTSCRQLTETVTYL
jgi:hypothetical protein